MTISEFLQGLGLKVQARPGIPVANLNPEEKLSATEMRVLGETLADLRERLANVEAGGGAPTLSHFIFVGDSRYDANGGGTPVPDLVAAGFAGTTAYSFQRFSYPGAGVSQANFAGASINSYIAGTIGPAITTAISAGKQVYVIMEGGLNQLGGNAVVGLNTSANVANLTTALQSFHSQVQALGAKSAQETVFMGVANSFTSEQQDAETAAILALNAALRSDYRASDWNLELVIDTISDARLATPTATLDTTIYYSDGGTDARVHLTALGKTGAHAPTLIKAVPLLVAGTHAVVTSDYVPGNTTPAAPTFTGFDDTANTVTLVPASGIPLSDYRVSLPGSTTFAAVSSAAISVGDVAGTVRAYSVAATGRNQSPTGTSSAFTVASSGGSTVEVLAATDNAWVNNVGGWQPSSGSQFYPGAGDGRYSDVVGGTRTTEASYTGRYFDLLAPLLPGCGIIELAVMNGSTVVTSGTFNHEQGGVTQKAGYPDDVTAQLTLDAGASGSYQIRVKYLSGPSAVAYYSVRARS